MAKTNVGVMPCPCCGKDVVVKSNENDTLSCTCQWCDSSQYQRKGTMAHKLWLARMQSLEGEAAEVVGADAPVAKKSILEELFGSAA